MKRLALLGFAGVLATVLAGCPIWPEEGHSGGCMVNDCGPGPVGGCSGPEDCGLNETCGDDWLHPDWFRFGASSLLNDLLMQRTKLTTGHYSGPDYFTLD